MKDVVLITGGNGMVAKYFGEYFSTKYSIRYLTRNKINSNQFEWDISKNYIDKDAFVGVKHIIHLAGSGIANKRWTKKRKEKLISSRIDSAKLILKYLQNNNQKLISFISASAIGYYGSQTKNSIHCESEMVAKDFLGNLCNEWEYIANQFREREVAKRVVILRLGVILSRTGGALQKMKLPIKYYLGSPIASGKQYMPWIHIDDVVSIIDYSISNSNIFGAFNAIAPEYITNKELTIKLSQILGKPLIFPNNIPKFVLRILFGEMSIMLTDGSRVSADKIVNKGFIFKFLRIDDALKNLFE